MNSWSNHEFIPPHREPKRVLNSKCPKPIAMREENVGICLVLDKKIKIMTFMTTKCMPMCADSVEFLI
jgi:hypothetical protein